MNEEFVAAKRRDNWWSSRSDHGVITRAACLNALRFMALALIFLPQFVRADLSPLNGAAVAPNIAEITIREDAVYVALEVYVGDFAAFQELLPDEFLNSDTSNRPPVAERLRMFSEQGLSIVADGINLTPELLIAEPRKRMDRAAALASAGNPLSTLPTPEAPEDDRVFYAELKYPFEKKPNSLMLIPPQNPNGSPRASIGFIAFHETVPVIDFRYLSHPERLQMDWEDPWYTRFDNKNLKRHHTSALMTFLYVEPREVRHETLIRVRDLQDWVDLKLDEVGVLDAAAQDNIKALARAFLASTNPVMIDGKSAEATSSRAEFLTVKASGLQIAESGDDLDLPNAILGVILSFPVPALPQNVTVDWKMFNENNTSIQATATDPAGPFLRMISPGEPLFKWENYLKTFEKPKVKVVLMPVNNSLHIPLLSTGLVLAGLIAVGFAVRRRRAIRLLLLAGATVGVVFAAISTSIAVIDIRNPFEPLPDEVTSARIFTAILENVGTANLEIAAERRNGELALVVPRNALRDVTEELDRALAIRVAGGGLARVDEVENVVLKDILPLEIGKGFQALASWTVKASAGHWGHNHNRQVAYRALVELSEQENIWKLSAITVVDVRRLK